MYPFIPLGPLSIPTAPLFALLAGWAGLSIMARAGARQSLNPDLVMMSGIVALLAGIIVARLWHVVHFWGIYREEPLLIVSPRPGGMVLEAGIVAALVAGYAYLLYARLDPVKVTAALSLGLLVGEALQQVGGFLTGTIIGQVSGLPWAIPYFGEPVHPVGLYRAMGALLVAAALFLWGEFSRPGRIILGAILGYALVRLLADAFVADVAFVGPFRVSQVVAFLLALVTSFFLSRNGNPPRLPLREETV
jgi:phosphatidylglycerol---prolipoprotein diacylglyceryl transferase